MPVRSKVRRCFVGVDRGGVIRCARVKRCELISAMNRFWNPPIAWDHIGHGEIREVTHKAKR
jgi:hypothetical protein